MALHTLGTVAATSLQCIPAWSAALAPADVAAIGQSIVNDAAIGSILSGYSAGETAILATGTTHSNTTLDTLVARAGSPPLTQINVGDLVLGVGIRAGTFVSAIPSGTSVTLSQAATAGAAGVSIVFARKGNQTPKLSLADGILYVPNRGTLKVLPGDYVAIDNTGAVILVPGNAVGYAGSQWTFT